MTRSRFHHLTLALLCFALCHYIMLRDTSRFSWQWWFWSWCAAYALQPLINECCLWWQAWQAKRPQRDPYDLLPVDVSSESL